ncbi:MAG: hypothetical protein M3Y57_04070 [Acidobacteriota bacterium]|nr:hypothetical protein [Acidobacteriota bacterium]
MQTPDGAKSINSYSADSGADYTFATDPAGHRKKYTYDALSHWKSVLEDPRGLNYSTTYTYDPLNDLQVVTQGGETRTFAYDSLARLASATNPESGTTSYTYDNAGNLYQRSDARGVVATYGFDALNRPASTSYNNGTAGVSYSYDNANPPNGIGRLSL